MSPLSLIRTARDTARYSAGRLRPMGRYPVMGRYPGMGRYPVTHMTHRKTNCLPLQQTMQGYSFTYLNYKAYADEGLKAWRSAEDTP